MLALGGELELRHERIRTLPGEDDDLGRPGGQIDGDLARHEQLRLVHVRAARAADLVHPRNRLRAIGERRDRRWTAERPHLVDPEEPRGGGDEPRAGRRRRDGDAADAGHERRDSAHDQGRDEAARDVDADRGERRPAPLELDTGLTSILTSDGR